MTSKKSIETLVEDIEKVLQTGTTIDEVLLQNFSGSMSNTLKDALEKREPRGTLRMSNIGTPCERKLWYHVNKPGEGIPLTGQTYMKFLTGHLLEEAMLFLAELAGHKVEGRQDEVDVYGIKGHRDAIIDGVIVDVKSASSYSFKKFAGGNLAADDPFGYIPQLMGYLESGQSDDKVLEKNRAAFLVIDKALGHICLDFHERKDWDWEKIMEHKRAVVASPDLPPRSFEPEPMGAKGNQKLGTFCSYCDFREKCHPSLRTFLYSTGPVFLTTVIDTPKVFEVIADT